MGRVQTSMRPVPACCQWVNAATACCALGVALPIPRNVSFGGEHSELCCTMDCVCQVHDELGRAKEQVRELKLRIRQLGDELEAREARRASTSSVERMRCVTAEDAVHINA